MHVRVSWTVSKQGCWMPPPFATDPPAERGKERTEYPGRARSAMLASSPAGRSQVSVSSMMSMLLSWMKVDMSDLLLEVPTDLALKRQTRNVFGWRRTKGNMKQLSVRGTQRNAKRGGWEVVTVTGWRGRWYGSGVLTLIRVREESWTEMVKSSSAGWRQGVGELEESDGSRSRKPTITLIFLRSFFPPLLDRRGFLGTFLAMPRFSRL